MKTVENIIIGAGPAGLAVAGRMSKHQLPYEILEQSDKVGIRWRNHYDRLLLHTVKEFSHLPYKAFPDHYPRYVSKQQFVDYLEDYTKEFDIKPQFNQTVKSIKRENNQWLVETQNQALLAKKVVVATGINRVPNIPNWPGEQKFQGQIIHSILYKNVKPFLGKRVLVIGLGNTGAELALDLSEHGVKTFLSVRSPVNIVPRDVMGRPVQVTGKMLAKLPFKIGDWIGSKVGRLVVGDLSKYGVPMSTVSPAVQLKEHGQTPVIDLGTSKQIKNGKIQVVGDIGSFFENGVKLNDGRQLEVDQVILATGYKAKIQEFLQNTEELLDSKEIPIPQIGTGKYSGLYFAGFDYNKLGGILGTIIEDSKLIVNDLLNNK